MHYDPIANLAWSQCLVGIEANSGSACLLSHFDLAKADSHIKYMYMFG